MAAAGEHCLSTSFCMWCQDALGWYIYSSGNDGLKETLGRRVATGDVLGGTALSNPMKTFFGIEQIRLKGKRVPGGYVVRGALPFVSNLGPDHYFGSVFELEDEPKHYVMAVVPCAAEGITLYGNTKFVALDGTRTFGVQLRDVHDPRRAGAGRSERRLHQAHPRGLRAAAGRHGVRPDPRLHRR